jgi:4-hydroxybenzoate polyprenyltransferase
MLEMQKRTAQELGNVTMVLPKATKVIHLLLRPLRVHQWVKNLLIFVPLLASHTILQLELIGQTVLAFLSISLCASSTYVVNDVVNDLSDIESDRRHHSKQRRPFASGELSIPGGLLMAPLLAAGGIALSLMLPPIATAIVSHYPRIMFTHSLPTQ